jgi:predicted Zn finger-like uncharacterized protein
MESTMTIIVRCEECEKRYRVPDERAGKSVKCKECGTILLIPPLDEPPKSRDGTDLLRHEPRVRDFELAAGNEVHLEAISAHIEKHIGPVHRVFHEIISDLVHIDVHWVKPSDERPWHTLVTSGMSDRPMTVPDVCQEFQFAELMIQLPKSWKISQEAFSEERNYWPVRLLKVLARLPHEYDTWLGSGHTVPNGDPAEPYAENTAFSCALILPPLNVDEDFHKLAIDDDRSIHFYSIVPLYPEETNYKLDFGLDKLLAQFSRHNIEEVIDIRRVNTCRRKKWFGLF